MLIFRMYNVKNEKIESLHLDNHWDEYRACYPTTDKDIINEVIEMLYPRVRHFEIEYVEILKNNPLSGEKVRIGKLIPIMKEVGGGKRERRLKFVDFNENILND